MHIVIIGNGVAGIEAALGVRARSASVEITVVSEESDHFFSRTALMWVHAGQLSHRDLEPYARDLYARERFERVRARVLGVDLSARQLRLSGERPMIAYDRLLIASGSRPRPGPWPGTELPGVGAFVSLQDLAWYQEELLGAPAADQPPRHTTHLPHTTPDSPYASREAAASRRGRAAESVGIIGGGLIGIEAAEVALSHGFRPHFFLRDEWFWPMALNGRESGWITARLEDHGVQVHTQHHVEALHADATGCVAQVQTDRGNYPCEAVVEAIGVVPNTGFLADSGLALDAGGGVQVDATLRTSDPHVFAAGDCASVPGPDGDRRPEQLWYTARDQGRVAAASLLGEPAHYGRDRVYNSAKLIDIEYTTVGLVPAKGDEMPEWFFEETGAVRSTTRIVLEEERVVGFNLLGRRWDHSLLLDWIDAGRTLPWVLAHLNEASFDTEFVPPLRVPDAFDGSTSAHAGKGA